MASASVVDISHVNENRVLQALKRVNHQSIADLILKIRGFALKKALLGMEEGWAGINCALRD